MLIPLNLKNAEDVALSVVETPEGYSVLPCNIVNGFGLSELPSYWANKSRVEDEFDLVEPVPMFGFEPSMKCEGPNLYDCIREVLTKLEKKYNQ